MTRRSVQFVVTGVIVAMLSGCIWWPKSPTSPLVGNWTNSLGTVWTIKEDGTFDADFTRNGERDVWGKYKVHGTTVTLIAKGGWKSKTCSGQGVYTFQRDGDNLHFSLVSDTCKVRRTNLILPWRLKK